MVALLGVLMNYQSDSMFSIKTKRLPNYILDRFHQKVLTHRGQVTHICVGNLAIFCSDNGLSPGQHQAINWTNVEILLIGP